MSLKSPRRSNQQLVRLLQICLVLEEIVEARATKQAKQSGRLDEETRRVLEETVATSARHRQRLTVLLESVDADSVSFGEVQQLVDDRYEAEKNFENPLYDQLCNSETLFKLYETLIETLTDRQAEPGLDSEYLRSGLKELRAEETESVQEITRLLESRA